MGQGSSMIWPAPPHCGQGWLIEKKPWLWASMPRPSQRGQVIGAVPGLAPLPWQVWQRPDFGTVTLIWAPLTAWSKLSWTSVSRSRPRICCRWARPPPPRLKIEEKMSPKSPAPKPPWAPPPGPNGPWPPPNPANIPPESYSLRFSGSERVS